jgi:hypothetical protein
MSAFHIYSKKTAGHGGEYFKLFVGYNATCVLQNLSGGALSHTIRHCVYENSGENIHYGILKYLLNCGPA